MRTELEGVIANGDKAIPLLHELRRLSQRQQPVQIAFTMGDAPTYVQVFDFLNLDECAVGKGIRGLTGFSLSGEARMSYAKLARWSNGGG